MRETVTALKKLETYMLLPVPFRTGVLAAPAAVTAAPARRLLKAPDTLAGAIAADANLSTLLAAVNVTRLPIDVSSPETAGEPCMNTIALRYMDH